MTEAQAAECRKAFEKWAVSVGRSVHRKDDGTYLNRIEDEWRGFQAAWNRRPESGSVGVSRVESSEVVAKRVAETQAIVDRALASTSKQAAIVPSYDEIRLAYMNAFDECTKGLVASERAGFEAIHALLTTAQPRGEVSREEVEQAFKEFSKNGPLTDEIHSFAKRMGKELQGIDVTEAEMRLAAGNFMAGWVSALHLGPSDGVREAVDTKEMDLLVKRAEEAFPGRPSVQLAYIAQNIGKNRGVV